MAQLDWLKKIAVKIDSSQNPIFKLSAEKQKEYFERFEKPKSDFDRSYFQYKCQMHLRGWVQIFFMNLCAFPLYLYYMIKCQDNESAKYKTDAVFMREGRPENILPSSLKNRFYMINYNPVVKMRLSKTDKRFINKIWREHPFSWLFLLKNLIKISRYSYVINSYNPEAMIVAAEYSFTSSILTRYCEDVWNIKHINVQHGEKLYTIWDSWFRFHEMFVWEEYYKTLLTSLGANEEQFKIELPPSMRFITDGIPNKEYDYCYYLAAEGKEELKIIHEMMVRLKQYGKSVIIRPHPRYSDMSAISVIFSDIQIEDSKEVSVEKSISRTKNAISLFSTVLNQAYNNQTSIIIDDISNPSYFDKLKEMKYICLQYNHNLLSQIVGAINEK